MRMGRSVTCLTGISHILTTLGSHHHFWNKNVMFRSRGGETMEKIKKSDDIGLNKECSCGSPNYLRFILITHRGMQERRRG